MSDWVYAVLCIFAPALWSVLVHFAFKAVERRRRRFRQEAEPPPVDYSI